MPRNTNTCTATDRATDAIAHLEDAAFLAMSVGEEIGPDTLDGYEWKTISDGLQNILARAKKLKAKL